MLNTLILLDPGRQETSPFAICVKSVFSRQRVNPKVLFIHCSVLQGVICKWNHGADPVHHLCFDEQLAAFRQRIAANPDYLKEKVREYFLVRKS